jgi:hypothetical protein
MSETTKKKPYSAPQLLRVELNQDQAILTACSLMASNISNSSSPGFCHSSGSCKRRNTGGGSTDNSGRRS